MFEDVRPFLEQVFYGVLGSWGLVVDQTLVDRCITWVGWHWQGFGFDELGFETSYVVDCVFFFAESSQASSFSRPAGGLGSLPDDEDGNAAGNAVIASTIGAPSPRSNALSASQ